MIHGMIRSYMVLRKINQYNKKEAKGKNYKREINILYEDFFDSLKYEKRIVEEILADLARGGYILDTSYMKVSRVHAVKITDKGRMALDNIFRLL